MNRKQAENAQDLFQLVRKLRKVIQKQKETLQEYKMMCDSLLNQKNIALSQIAQLKKHIQHLTRKYQQQKLNKSTIPYSTQDLFLYKKPKQYVQNTLMVNSPLLKIDVANSNMTIFLGSPSESHIKKDIKSKEFIPAQVIFVKKRHNNFAVSGLLNESVSESGYESVGEFMIEDLMIVGPDINELKKLREQNRELKQLKIQQFSFFNINKMYRNKKADYLKDVSKRSFPLGASAIRKTVDNIEEFKASMEFISQGRMNEDCFVFNLKGDFNQPPHNQKIFLGNCNPFRAMYVVCLRVPDFIPIRDEKHYQRREQQVWMVNKVYAILTYYPFIQVHLSILSKIHKMLQPNWSSLHREQIFSRNLSKNLAQAQKNQDLMKMIGHFMTKRPDYNQICQIQRDYFGTIPNFGAATEYSIARFACSIFFSIFAYEQTLLLLTALFMQKSIIFASKSEGAGTLCALFLVSVIAPFVYSHHLILNCTDEMVQNIVFGFPLTLVASLKKTANFTNILSAFIQNNADNFKGFQQKQTAQLILVDIDSNSIFYDPELNKIFQQIICEPSKQFRQAYMEVNCAHSKGFTFPKKMPVQISARPKNDYEKNVEEKKKLLKEYSQKIDNNTSKWPTYITQPSHLRVLEMLTDYIQTFSIDRDCHHEVIKLHRDYRSQYGRQHLIKKNPDKAKLIDLIVGSQMFADYLDQLQKGVQSQPHHS